MPGGGKIENGQTPVCQRNAGDRIHPYPGIVRATVNNRRAHLAGDFSSVCRQLSGREKTGESAHSSATLKRAALVPSKVPVPHRR